MISPREVMRGNVLSYEGKVQIVKGVAEYIMFEGWKEWVGGSLINGEPLTEQWLDRLGFEWVGNPSSWNRGKVSIVLKGDSYPNGRTYFNSWAIREDQPEFVHQLQVLYFGLTREHLIIPKLK